MKAVKVKFSEYRPSSMSRYGEYIRGVGWVINGEVIRRKDFWQYKPCLTLVEKA